MKAEPDVASFAVGSLSLSGVVSAVSLYENNVVIVGTGKYGKFSFCRLAYFSHYF